MNFADISFHSSKDLAREEILHVQSVVFHFSSLIQKYLNFKNKRHVIWMDLPSKRLTNIGSKRSTFIAEENLHSSTNEDNNKLGYY